MFTAHFITADLAYNLKLENKGKQKTNYAKQETQISRSFQRSEPIAPNKIPPVMYPATGRITILSVGRACTQVPKETAQKTPNIYK